MKGMKTKFILLLVYFEYVRSFISPGTVANIPCGSSVGTIKQNLGLRQIAVTLKHADLTGLDEIQQALIEEIKEKVSTNDGIPTVNSMAEKKKIMEYITRLELLGDDLDLSKNFQALEGKWRLLFTTNNGGVPRSSPITFKRVFQTISKADNSVKNTVYFDIAGFSESDFTLDHSFDIVSSSRPAKIEITLKEFLIGQSEDKDSNSFNVPVLKKAAQVGSGSFEITYIGDKLRISRGNLGEVRVFERLG